jgi:DNA-binding NarL/FixJ family response regulator
MHTGYMSRPALSAELTAREQEVAALVAEGRTNSQVAQSLGVSPTTAKWHVSQILHKLGLRGRVQLALYAREHGFTPPRLENGPTPLEKLSHRLGQS